MQTIQISEDHKNQKIWVSIERMTETNYKAIKNAFMTIGKKLKKDTNTDILRKPRFGRVYRYKGRKHVASVRGEAPANRSGFLRKSLDWAVESATNMRFGYLERAYYGEYLETGSLDRPALKINILKNTNIMRMMFELELSKAFTKGK